MLFHAVLFNFKKELGEDRKEEILGLARKLSEIPGVRNLLAGRTINEGGKFEYGLTMYFEDEEALREYREHPDHVRFRDVDFFPFVEDKLGLDYTD